MLLALTAAALASPMILDVGDDVALAVGGGWARAIPVGDGTWRFLWAAGGEYNVVPMSADLGVVDRDRLELTGRTDLVDHAFAPCPDGTWLHAASARAEGGAYSLYAFRYDADLARIGSAVVAEGVTMALNDPVALCAGTAEGLDLAGAGYSEPILYRLGADAAPTESVTLSDAPQLMGGSMVWEAETSSLLLLGGIASQPIQIARYDAAFTPLGSATLALPPEGDVVYWPQAVVRIGDWYVLAYMSRGSYAGFNEDSGNVDVAVLDLSWAVVEHVQVTTWDPPDGGMRPSLALQGDRLLVLYDRLTTPHVVPLTLDLVAFGVAEAPVDTGDDTGAPPADTAPPIVDTGTHDEQDAPLPALTPERRCGCGGDLAGAPVGLATALALLAVRRRRSG